MGVVVVVVTAAAAAAVVVNLHVFPVLLIIALSSFGKITADT